MMPKEILGGAEYTDTLVLVSRALLTVFEVVKGFLKLVFKAVFSLNVTSKRATPLCSNLLLIVYPVR